MRQTAPRQGGADAHGRNDSSALGTVDRSLRPSVPTGESRYVATSPRASGRRLLGLVPIEDALGAIELAGHVIGVVVDLPGRAPQRVVGDVRSKHAPLDAGGLDDVPDRLIVPVEVVREPDEIEAG